MTDSPASFLIAGCGVSGRGAARLASFLHYDYSIVDEKDTPDMRNFVSSLEHPPVKVCFGWKTGDPLPSAAQAVLSPGIRETSPLYPALKKAVSAITGELDFALKRLPCPYVGVTGTNGKTTVTELTSVLLNASGMRTAAAGNIGFSLCDAVIQALRREIDCVVVEISSFQLETMEIPHPAAAVLLNLASDHMDRYSSFEDYASLKFKLLRGMSSGCILNHELRGIARRYLNPKVPRLTFSTTRKTAFYSMRGDFFCRDGKELFAASPLPLKGRHNMENILASLGLLEAIRGVDSLRSAEVYQALLNFHPAAHRQELFLEKNGVRYVDDSKATNPHAVNAALGAVPGKSRVILILGGQDKDMDFNELLPHLRPVRLALCVGQASGRISEVIKSRVKTEQCSSFEDAVRRACQAAGKGDTVMLSPACASFDMFRGYAERGDVFQSLVRKYLAEEK